MRSGKRWDKKRNEDLTNEERRRIEEMRKNKRRQRTRGGWRDPERGEGRSDLMRNQ